MAQTKDGAIKIAAKRRGISREDYLQKIHSGQKWCAGCKEWHHYTCFGMDSSRTDGLATACIEYRRWHLRKNYKPKERVSKLGIRLVKPRDGDKKQARRRVNHLVYIGLLPNPNTLPCIRCGNINNPSRRNEYHHHKGYAKEHHEDVVPLCSVCHGKETFRDQKNRDRDLLGRFS